LHETAELLTEVTSFENPALLLVLYSFRYLQHPYHCAPSDQERLLPLTG
jgi:hypothetical protein